MRCVLFPHILTHLSLLSLVRQHIVKSSWKHLLGCVTFLLGGVVATGGGRVATGVPRSQDTLLPSITLSHLLATPFVCSPPSVFLWVALAAWSWRMKRSVQPFPWTVAVKMWEWAWLVWGQSRCCTVVGWATVIKICSGTREMSSWVSWLVFCLSWSWNKLELFEKRNLR